MLMMVALSGLAGFNRVGPALFHVGTPVEWQLRLDGSWRGD